MSNSFCSTTPLSGRGNLMRRLCWPRLLMLTCTVLAVAPTVAARAGSDLATSGSLRARASLDPATDRPSFAWANPDLATTRSPLPGGTYEPPVDAPVTDPFRPPSTPYGPGNRGIDYATEPGTPVRAAGDGLVVFAGPVAGALHVTLLHGDALRTSYSFLAAIRVGKGQRVAQGDVVGIAAATFHVGARRGDMYIDPASLWGSAAGPPRVHLVPLDGYRARRAERAGRRAERGWLLRSAPSERSTTGSIAGLAGATSSGGASGIREPMRPSG